MDGLWFSDTDLLKGIYKLCFLCIKQQTLMLFLVFLTRYRSLLEGPEGVVCNTEYLGLFFFF